MIMDMLCFVLHLRFLFYITIIRFWSFGILLQHLDRYLAFFQAPVQQDK